MAARLAAGAKVVQGQHVIGNSRAGWFPALVWAMTVIDNCFQNLGRANIGWSSKIMGDSICIRADLFQQFGWGEGKADDHQLRHRLLFEGIKVAYEPAAIAYGEAPVDWRTAWPQRLRWIEGVRATNRRHGRRLLIEGIRQRDFALVDAALQAYAPAYSTLAAAVAGGFLLQTLVNHWAGAVFPDWLLRAWAALLALLFLYPFAGLAIARAPFRAYIAICLGPLFIGWRTAIAIAARRRTSGVWTQTPHVGQDPRKGC
jgi:cellulose synthase/poly-beta-1,6-N-acetylglucosamine synthase-like glycosyltransferase